jgi:hypothetical protein
MTKNISWIICSCTLLFHNTGCIGVSAYSCHVQIQQMCKINPLIIELCVCTVLTHLFTTHSLQACLSIKYMKKCVLFSSFIILYKHTTIIHITACIHIYNSLPCRDLPTLRSNDCLAQQKGEIRLLTITRRVIPNRVSQCSNFHSWVQLICTREWSNLAEI